ncbi:MAG: glycosyltransferase family 4 protein [Bacteroidales bacterium]|jgi:glycosyltransferase involved in cell wall biosynthesis|nr:glycosyltransferase family 4 protein [Bacteroidales bacterium]
MNPHNNIHICHLTSVHSRFDSRIFYKECVSLAQYYYKVSLVVADGKGNQLANGISITDIGVCSSRIKRLFSLSAEIYKAALDINADIYHFHDPELLIIGLKLRKKGYKVVFDSHENFPLLARQRDYVPKMLKEPLYCLTTLLEKYITRRLSGVISATDDIRAKFNGYGVKHTQTIKNYPIISVSQDETLEHTNSVWAACYAGGLTQIRGIEEIVLACDRAKVPLILAGSFDSEAFFDKLKSLSAWKNVEYLSVVPHSQIVTAVYQKAAIGLVVLHAAPNHIRSIPIKMLEYMANGLAVVASDAIEFCVEVIENEKCGIVVKPDDVEAISRAVKYLFDNPQTAKEMGENGKKAVANRYNWHTQEVLLADFYETIIADGV